MNVTIIIPIAFKTNANLEAKSFDVVGGEFTFTNELNAAGGAADAPATHVWCHVASIAPATVDAIEARVSQIPGAMLFRDLDPYSILHAEQLQTRQAGPSPS